MKTDKEFLRFALAILNKWSYISSIDIDINDIYGIEFLTPTELKEFLATKEEEWKDSLIGILLGDISRFEIALMGMREENEN